MNLATNRTAPIVLRHHAARLNASRLAMPFRTCYLKPAFPRWSPSPGIRCMATTATPNSGPRLPLSRRSGLVISILVVLALSGYGLRELYGKVIVWPKDMRKELRAAIKAKNHDDYKTAVCYYRKALDRALGYGNPVKELGKDYRIKISGLMIAMASALEGIPDIPSAIQAYQETLAYLSSPRDPHHLSQADISSSLTPTERYRVITIAAYLGELASKIKDTATEERYLTVAVEEAIRLGRYLPSKIDSRSSDIETQDESWNEDVNVPVWVDRTEIGSVFERLADFYGREGNLMLAVPLYMQAISFLMATEDKAAANSSPLSIWRSSNVSRINMCRAAQLMTNVASLFANTKTASASNAVGGNVNSADGNHLLVDGKSHAKVWASRALDLVLKAISDLPGKDKEDVAGHECSVTLAHSLHSMGMLSEDEKEKKRYLEQSLAEARKAGFQEGIEAARTALRHPQ